MRIIDYFDQGLRRGPDLAAFIDGDHIVSWREMKEYSETLAGALCAGGLTAASHVGVFSPNDAMAFAAMLGAFRLGAVWVPINARNTIDANQHWLDLIDCHCLFYHSSLEAGAMALAPLLQAPALLVCLDRDGPGDVPSLASFIKQCVEPAPPPPDGPGVTASLFATGGTTGMSKAAIWTLQTWETLISTFWQCLPADELPVHLVAGPMTHAAGIMALSSLPGGTTNVFLKKADPTLILEAIQKYRVTHMYLPPTLIYSLLDVPNVRNYDYSSLKYLVVAAAPISPGKLREAMDVFGPVLCQSYGQAEAPMFMTFMSTRDLQNGGPERWASCGRSTLATQVEIMAPDGFLLDVHQRGEIVTRGNLLMAGYYNNPEATKAVGEFDWHHTGDIGYRDEAGFIYIVDRQKDMIITGGFNVFSAEVEQVILFHPAVLDCAVVGVPDPKWGEAVKAVVELKRGTEATATDIIALVKQKLGSVHAPKSVEFWPTLPRSPAGKVLKRDIREGFWKGQPRSVS